MSGVVETVEVSPTQAVGRLLHPEGWRVERTFGNEGGVMLRGPREVDKVGSWWPHKQVPHGETVTVVIEDTPADDAPLYGITIQQPYASLIAHRIKTIETRGYQPRVVKPGGDIAIVAGAKVFPFIGHADAWDALAAALGYGDSETGEDLTDDQGAPLSAVVAVARFVEALPMEKCPPYSTSFDDRWEPPADGVIYLGGLDGGPWMFTSGGHGPYLLNDQLPYGIYEPGRFGWLLDNVRRLPEPIPCTGFQGLRALPDDVTVAVRQAVQ